MALPAPRQKVRISSHHSVVISRCASTVSATAETSSQTCSAISTVRRLQMSPITPAGYDSRKNGKVVAVWISATIRLDGAMLAINQVTPTSFIQVPMLDTVMPSHITRNSGYPSGDQIEREMGGGWPITGIGCGTE